MSGIEKKLAGLSAEQRAFVELQLQRAKTVSQPSIPRRAGDQPSPLSFAQQRLWLMSQLDPASPAYVMPGAARLTGPLNLRALEAALNAIVDRHEGLRTTFALAAVAGEEPQQTVHTDVRVPVDVVDLTALPADAREAEARRIAIRVSREPFDLANGPLLRAAVVKLASDDHVLVLTAHHIVSDGWSMAIFVGELGDLYRAFDTGVAPSLPPLPIQYADFAVWQRNWLQGARLDAQVDYWKRNLAGVPVLQLPVDRPRPTVPGSDGAFERLTLAPDVLGRLKALSQAEGSTLFMTLLAGFNLLLARYCDQDDIAVGSPIANRTRAEIEGLIGCFVNTLVLRADLSGDPTVRTLLARVRETALGAFAHQDLPFERLVDELQPERSVGQNPLFQVIFALQNAPSGTLDLGGVVLSAFEFPLTTTRFDLEVHASERPDGLGLRVCYRTDLFEPATMRRLLRHYATLLEAMSAAPEAKISELPMLDADERRQLFALNPEPTPYPRESIVSVFESQVKARPDTIAVDYGDGAGLTYRQLNAAANRLARRLRSAGVERGMPVGVLAERTPELIVGLIAILKAGGAYLPLDPEYPADRLQFMIRDSGLRVVVHHEHLRAALPEDLQRDLALVALEAGAAPDDEPDAGASVGADDLAFIVYTSGSTGLPKGSALTHGGILRTVCNVNYMQITPDERISQGSSISFDAATFEIWAPLLNGGRLVGIEKNAAFSAAAIARLVSERGLTTLFVTTALFNQIAREHPAAFAPLKHVLFGGEAVDSGAVAAVMRSGPPAQLIHMYGPSESTTYGTWYRVPRTPPAIVPIGRAVSNTTLYVLDRALQPVPLGVTGELYIGGDGLSRGYLNRPALTAERFIPDPFGVAGGRLYRTGDLVRWTHDRQVEFVGRNDNQVKIRGFRIELGEIEATLRSHPDVKDTTVIARQDDGDRRLVAYIVPSGASASSESVRAFLRERLPDYMVPSAFVTLAALPLTANGKIDRRALPAPAAERQLHQELVLPRTDLERRIAAAWREVLQLPEVGVSDNFFDLGGHSLRLLQVHGRLAKSLDREVPIVDLFRFPTIASLAAHIGDDGAAAQVPVGRSATARRRRGASVEREPIAVIGMAGRFPGAPDVEAFWQNLRNGVESIGHFTDDEVRAAGVSETLLANPRFVKAFGVVPGFDLFDAGFFGYSAREAGQMDPQHRHFLECAWEALELAGYDPQEYKGRIGVYAGCSPNLYLLGLLSQMGSSGASTMAMFLGNVSDYLTTRVSYKLNLRGPSVNVQNACSTSLVALHHACQSLLSGECDMAMAGGVNMKRSLATGYMYEEGGILSPDGHCRAFDANARGTVGGSGVGIVVLKLLADAIADGDRIHSVILGTAINNDGSDKVGFTAPGVHGQATVIAAAHAAANVDPRTIGYIEAHGTGTLLGDPIEMEALSQAFGRGSGQSTCAVGSVKSNIGHLDAAAGVASLIKATLALEHREIPPSLHFVSPNPKMRLDETPFYVSTQLHAWPEGRTARRAGVSAFGIGGTNAHIVLEEAPALEASSESRPSQLIVLSARTKAALDRATDNLAARLDAVPDMPLADMAFTLQTGRRRFRHRRMVVCDSIADLRAALRDRDPKRVISADAAASGVPVAFVFPGQGAQSVDMGRGLYEREPVFRAAVDRCAELLRPELNGDLRDVLYPSAEHVDSAAEQMRQTAWSQPAIFVVEYALAQLWQSWGVAPQAMLGHSLGEYVAACLAGVFSLEDALVLVAARGRMMQALPPGGMVAAPVDEAAIRPLLTAGLSIASINGPSATVVSGPFDEIEAFERVAAEKGITTRRLVTSHAFHSSMLDPMLGGFEALVKQLRPQPPTLRFISNVTGTWITTAEATDPAYWVTHLRGTVRFGDGLATLLEDGKSLPLEVGPGQGLTSLARRLVSGGGRDATASLPSRTAGSTDARDIVEALGRLWLGGATIDWTGFYANERRHRVVLPTYPFDRQRFELGAGAPAPQAAAGPMTKRSEVATWLYSPIWKRTAIHTDEGAPTPAVQTLVLGNLDGVGSDVARSLGDTALVRRGSRFEKLGDREYVVDPRRREDLDVVLRDLESQNRFPARVLHAWEASAPSGEEGFESLRSVLQSVVGQAGERNVAVTVLASGMHAVNADERLAPGTALMVALGRVSSQEHPNLQFKTVDVVETDTAWARQRVVDQIVREMASGSSEPGVAYRGLERYVETFEAAALRSAAAPVALRDRGVYLITGGLGSIGLTMAEHFVTTARARVVLVGRSGLPARDQWDGLLASPGTAESVRRRIERVRHIESRGGEVLIVGADVTRVDDMRAAIASAEQQFGPLNGVIHGAALTEADILVPTEGLSMAECRRQLAPKVDATIVLEQVLGDRPLDFCLLMSSLSAVLGGLGLGAYAAGNAFLDAFAHEHNRRHPTPWVSVNWDGWTMNLASSGVTALSMTHVEGMQALDLVLRMLPASRALVSTGDLAPRIRRHLNPKYVGDSATVLESPTPAALGATASAISADASRRPLADWFYAPSWKRSVPPPAVSMEPGASRWLIFADDDGFGDELARRAALNGCATVIVRPREQFAVQQPGEFAIAPGSRADYTKLLTELAAGSGLPTHIVHCWNVSDPDQTPERVDSAGFLSLLYLAQALAAHAFPGPMRLHVITSRAYEVTGLESLVPEHALAAGALRVIPQEDPRLLCVHMDVDAAWAATPERQWRALLAECVGDDGERFVAYRAGHRWVQTYEPMSLPAAETHAPLREHGVYLVTGGFGGVGLAIARHMAKTVGARLVLTSRRVLPARSTWSEYLGVVEKDDRTARDIRAIQDLEGLGAEVMVAAADVCDDAQMRRVVVEAVERFGALHGVVHAAGVAGGGLIQLKDREAAARVLAPKTLGTRTVARVVDGQPLDFFVLCSSLASFAGGIGQIDYCAANSYQDAFARAHANRTGVRTLAVNWDIWRDAGMAVETALPGALRARREQYLKEGMSSNEGVEALIRALRRTDVPQIAVSTLDLPARLRPRPAAAAPGEAPAETPREAEAEGGGHARPELGTDYVAPRSDVERSLCQVWQEVLGVSQIGVNDDFFELGGHSLLALQMLSRMRERLGVDLSIHTIFNAPTVGQLAELVKDTGGGTTEAASLDRMEQLLSMVEGLPEEELKDLPDPAGKLAAQGT